MAQIFHIDAKHQPAARQLGLDAETIFSHPLIQPWRVLDDRQNCLLQATLANGQAIRWHVKRYSPRGGPAAAEVAGWRLLNESGIPTMDLVGHGRLADGRSFVIFDDLAGYEDAEKLIEAGADPEPILAASAELAARLHEAGLHHRDLYLCHFFANVQAGRAELRLIDVARVRRLPRWFSRRWIVKDLAQFWYSTLALPIGESRRQAWLQDYCRWRCLGSLQSLMRRIMRKAAWIGRHDRTMRRRQPNRNISLSIPGGPPT